MNHVFILIVEDEQNQRMILEEALRSVAPNCSVLSASSADEALTMLDQYTPDLIITDYSMPYMTGLDLIQHVRNRNIESHIILLSARSETEIAIDAERLQIDMYLTKPVPIQCLRHAASVALGLRAA